MANKLVKICHELFPDAGIRDGYMAVVETTDPFKIYCRIELTFNSREEARAFIANHAFK